MSWQDEEWNKPDRTDHYIMQNTLWAARAVTKHAANINRFRIPFRRMPHGLMARIGGMIQGGPNISSVAASMASEMMGGSFTLRRVDKEGNIISEEEIKPIKPEETPPSQPVAVDNRPTLHELMKARQARRRKT